MPTKQELQNVFNEREKVFQKRSQELQEVEKNNDLTIVAKNRRKAEINDKYAPEISALTAKEQRMRREVESTLTAKAFPYPSQSAADKMTFDNLVHQLRGESVEALTRRLETASEPTATAIARAAYMGGKKAVLDVYTELYPDTAEAIQEARDFAEAQGSRRSNAARITDSLFQRPATPQETAE